MAKANRSSGPAFYLHFSFEVQRNRTWIVLFTFLFSCYCSVWNSSQPAQTVSFPHSNNVFLHFSLKNANLSLTPNEHFLYHWHGMVFYVSILCMCSYRVSGNIKRRYCFWKTYFAGSTLCSASRLVHKFHIFNNWVLLIFGLNTDLHFPSSIQWNLDLTKSLVTGQICSLNRGFVISKTSI